MSAGSFIKSVHGLKQAPLKWNLTIDCHLHSSGFIPTNTDSCICIWEQGHDHLHLCQQPIVCSSPMTSTCQHVEQPLQNQGSWPLSHRLAGCHLWLPLGHCPGHQHLTSCLLLGWQLPLGWLPPGCCGTTLNWPALGCHLAAPGCLLAAHLLAATWPAPGHLWLPAATWPEPPDPLLAALAAATA